jgi:hypothetical protein
MNEARAKAHRLVGDFVRQAREIALTSREDDLAMALSEIARDLEQRAQVYQARANTLEQEPVTA